MKSLDDDVKEAISKMNGFMKMAQKKKIGPIRIITEEGIKIPNVSVFQMKPFYDEYGKNVIYYYDYNSKYVMFLGTYSHQEIMDSSLAITKSIKRNHINYMGIKKNNFVYLIRGPKPYTAPMLKITTERDGWSGNKESNLYVYHLKPDVLFMNWKESPFDQK
tara:strand:- start:5818 stop:6303 length:486 start_codon:yes stop_codon:yes gene_type:complete